MNLEPLRQFLIDSNAAGYAEGDEKQWIKEADGSTSIPFTKGNFRSHDNFFGGEPYGGRLVVFEKNQAVWLMVYYGWVEKGQNPDEVYAILRAALKLMPSDAPFRGPHELKKNNLTYSNEWHGTLERYSGKEKIVRDDDGSVLYEASYQGGLVDQRVGV